MKKLNLCELLCGIKEGTKFYSPAYGWIKYRGSINGVFLNFEAEKEGYVSFGTGGEFYQSSGRCMIWPSEESYQRSPLDPYLAWMDWEEDNKPNEPGRVCKNEEFYYIKEVLMVMHRLDLRDPFSKIMYENGNYFQTMEQAEKALEEIKQIFQDDKLE